MPVKQARGQQRYEQILEAALEVFSQAGYRDVAVDDIAAAAKTSKGGIYFHFPNKQAIFLALLDRMAALLRSRAEAAIATETDPINKIDVALKVVLRTFASHRTLARLFLVDALGAGWEFHERLTALRASFAELIQCNLDDAVQQGAIPPIDTAVASRVWFGALYEVVTDWVLTEPPGPLEEAGPTLRALLLRSLAWRRPAANVEPVSQAVAEPKLERLAPRLASQLEAGRRRAQQEQGSALVSVVLPVASSDPLTFFAAGSEVADERIFWSSPGDGLVMAGVGSAWETAFEGTDRFTEVEAAWRARRSVIVGDVDTAVPGTGPVLVGGFSFDPRRPATARWDGYPAGLLALPRYLLTRVDGRAWLTVNAVVWSDADIARETQALLALEPLLADQAVDVDRQDGKTVPTVEDVLPTDAWKKIVASVVADLGLSALEKVVLARECRVRGERPLSPARVLFRLLAEYPSCTVFAVGRGRRCFLGASPERLVRLQGRTVAATCLAGSIARGTTAEDDRRLGEALLASAKDREEHEIVVRALRAALTGVCVELSAPEQPVLLAVRNVQHLYTPLVGRVADGRTIFELVERLHPTPAVGGYPHDTALQVIRDREQLDRGWYAGPIGWVNAAGDGEFVVAIRSALLDGPEASLFAGCGIVADSDPENEYAESCLKLRPILSALGRSIR